MSSATRAAATVAGRAAVAARALLRGGGSRTLAAGGARGGSKAGFSSMGVPADTSRPAGFVAAASAVTLFSLSLLLSESEFKPKGLKGLLPLFLLEKLRQLPDSTQSLARIEEFYDIDSGETLGIGQFGTVSKGIDRATGEVVAVKCVPRSKASEKHVLEEADVHREVANHPNVVGLKGVFADEDSLYIVLELAAGGELYDRLTSEGFALKDAEVRYLLRNTAEALDFLADHSVVHGDLKPENLLLTAPPPAPDAPTAADDGGAYGSSASEGSQGVGAEPALQAFGQAGGEARVGKLTAPPTAGGDAAAAAAEGRGIGRVLLADFGSSFRTSGSRGGGGKGAKTVKEYTVAYSAPEVVDHSPEISTKADIWSLGCIAYVMVRGHHPFDPNSDADDDEIAESILHKEPDWDGLEPRAATLIRKMLAKDPRDRPSAREVLQNAWLQQ